MNGKIENFKNYTFLKDGTLLSRTGRPLKGKIERGRRYARLIDDDGIQHYHSIGRWILMAYTDENEWKDHAHHKDGNRSNDCLENLEWLKKSEHLNKHFGKIVAVNLITDEAFVFKNELDASKKLNIPFRQISKVITGSHLTSNGYWFTKIKSGGSPTS